MNADPIPVSSLEYGKVGDAPPAISPSRRRFLKNTVLGLAVLSASKLFPRTLVRGLAPDVIANQLRFFSEHEYMIVRVVTERIVGPTPRPAEGQHTIDVAQRADEFLSLADPEIQEQFHQLLSVFNGVVFAFLFDFRFSSFLDMNPEDQDSYLEDWMTSPLTFRRQVFVALKRLSLSMYYTEEQSWTEIGYTGLFLPWERP